MLEIKQKWGNLQLDFLWLSFLLFLVLILVFLLPLHPNDFWWYLRLGQDILNAGALPAVDTYSFTASGTPFIYHAWLSAITFWSVFKAGGLSLVILLLGVIIALFYLIIWLAARELRINFRIASLLLITAALAGSNNWQLRPQIFGYLFFALTIWILIRWQNGKNGFLWALPFIGMLWVNLHGSFLLIFICLGTALVFGKGDKKLLAVVLVITGLFTLINPDGLRVYQNMWLVMFQNASNQNFGLEWQPPVNRGWQMNLFFAWLLMLIPLAAFSSRKLPALLWIWLLGFGWMALSGTRYVFWALAIFPLVTGLFLQTWMPAAGRHPASQKVMWLGNFLILGLLLVPLAFLPGLRQQWWREAPPVLASSTPVAGAAWLQAHPELPGNMWNDFAYGSYLIYAVPERKVSIDTRLYPYSAQQIQDYLTVSRAEFGWQEILKRDGVRLIFAHVQEQPALIQALETDDSWCQVYRDETSTIFVQIRKEETCPVE